MEDGGRYVLGDCGQAERQRRRSGQDHTRQDERYFTDVEGAWRESRRHLGVEADLDSRLDLVFSLDERVEQLVGVDDRLSVVRHKRDDARVPLVDDLGEGRRSRGHEDLSDSVVEGLHPLVRDPDVGLGGPLLRLLVVEVPDRITSDAERAAKEVSMKSRRNCWGLWGRGGGQKIRTPS